MRLAPLRLRMLIVPTGFLCARLISHPSITHTHSRLCIVYLLCWLLCGSYMYATYRKKINQPCALQRPTPLSRSPKVEKTFRVSSLVVSQSINQPDVGEINLIRKKKRARSYPCGGWASLRRAGAGGVKVKVKVK